MTDDKKKNIGFRVSDEQFLLVNELVDRVKARYGYIDKSKVLREIIGLEKRQVVTDEDIRFLRSAAGVGDSGDDVGSEDERVKLVQGMRKFARFEGDSEKESGLG